MVVSLAEISLYHAEIALHRAWRTAGYDLPKIQHDDLIGDRHHHFHFVLDEEHRDRHGADGADQISQRSRFLTIQSGGGFVQQQATWLGSESPCNFDQPLLAIRQCARKCFRATAPCRRTPASASPEP